METAIWKMLTDKHIATNLNIAPEAIVDEIPRVDFIINSIRKPVPVETMDMHDMIKMFLNAEKTNLFKYTNIYIC